MSDPFALIDATWPALGTVRAGGFAVRRGAEGIKRISAASRAEGPMDLAAMEAAHAAFGQPPLVMVRPGRDDPGLDAALAARGYRIHEPVTILGAPAARLATPVPPLAAFAHWPALAIAREIWAEGGIGAARQAVMDRAAGPKAVILGRQGERAAGAAFVACAQGAAMLHALHVRPEARRGGLASGMMRAAAAFAAAEGAGALLVAVGRQNAPALALYDRLGMTRVCDYHYRVRDGAATGAPPKMPTPEMPAPEMPG